jgi:erythromycin esterase-like protein
MTIPTPLISGHREEFATAFAARVAHLPHPPRLLGFGEPTHGEDEFGRLRNAVFAALVDQAGFTSIALESSAWHGRVVDDYVGGADGDEDAVLGEGFSHGWGEFASNRELVRWMRERNRRRPPAERLRFAGFDAPVEMAGAPSPRAALRTLHDFLRHHGVSDLPEWDDVDRLLGPDDPWTEPAAAREPARSIGADPRVHELRAITDDLRRILTCEVPRSGIEDVLLAGRTAAGLLAYHSAMAKDTEHRWQRLSALRDAMMAENLEAIAERGPTLVFGHNLHLRTGLAEMPFGETVRTTLHWNPAGAHVARRFGADYRVVATALGEALHQDIPAPPGDTLEGVLHHGLPPGDHLFAASALRTLQDGLAVREAPTYRYFPIDDTLLDQVDEVVFLHTITP